MPKNNGTYQIPHDSNDMLIWSCKFGMSWLKQSCTLLNDAFKNSFRARLTAIWGAALGVKHGNAHNHKHKQCIKLYHCHDWSIQNLSFQSRKTFIYCTGNFFSGSVLALWVITGIAFNQPLMSCQYNINTHTSNTRPCDQKWPTYGS